MTKITIITIIKKHIKLKNNVGLSFVSKNWFECFYVYYTVPEDWQELFDDLNIVRLILEVFGIKVI